MTKRKKKSKFLENVKVVRNFIMFMYLFSNFMIGLIGTGDERMRIAEKELKRIEYAFPGYRMGRRLERALDPLITWLVGDP